MQYANELAERGRYGAPPNPWVGCVIVNEGEIVGEGFHAKYGEAHAEVNALAQAKEKAKGSTVYLTLEPCSHHGKTPPCVDLLIHSKVAKVVIAIEDPDPKVAGKGIQALQDAGIEVEVGTLSQEVEESLTSYIHHRMTGLPYCIGKAAISVDGRIAAKDGSSKWITSSKTREDVMKLRAESQAILVGAGTIIADDPKLTVRGISNAKNPIRVILDRSEKLAKTYQVFTDNEAETMVITSDNLKKTLKQLGDCGVLQLLIEGGSAVLGEFVGLGLLQELFLYIGPKILGDDGYPLFRRLSIPSIEDAKNLELIETKQIDHSVKIRYRFP